MSTDPITTVADWMREAAQVTALTGAGVSTASGIPDYRGPGGVWTKDPRAERLSNIRYYVSDPEVRAEAWRRRASGAAAGAEPNRAHRSLATLERAGHLHTVVTQNVDGLHLRAGTSRERLIEIHGTVLEVLCLDCDARQPAEPVHRRVLAGETDPRCEDCGGILKSATVSFGQSLDPDDVERATIAASEADVFLALGTSLTVYPVAGLPRLALDHGARLVIVNAQETPLDGFAHLVVNDDVGAFLEGLVGALAR